MTVTNEIYFTESTKINGMANGEAITNFFKEGEGMLKAQILSVAGGFYTVNDGRNHFYQIPVSKSIVKCNG